MKRKVEQPMKFIGGTISLKWNTNKRGNQQQEEEAEPCSYL